jgi:hypothetical protein
MLASAALALMAARKLRRRAGAPVAAMALRPALAAGEDARA